MIRKIHLPQKERALKHAQTHEKVKKDKNQFTVFNKVHLL